MKNSEVRRLAAKAFVDTLEVLQQSGTVLVYRTEVDSSIRHAHAAAVKRLYDTHATKIKDKRADDTQGAVEHLRFLIEVQALLAEPKPESEHETPK